MMIFIWIFVAILAFAFWFWVSADKPSQADTNAEIDFARESMDADLYRELSTLVSQGRKIEAIKRLREHSGVGLYAAKKVVDGL